MAANPLGSYSFVVCKSTGEQVGEAINAHARGLSMLLNGVHTAKLTLDLYDSLAPYLLPGVGRLKVYRTPSAAELAINPGQAKSLVFYGTVPEDALSEDADAGTVAAVFADPRFVLTQRYSLGTESFAATDQGAIGWGLIAAQNARTNGDTWLRQGGTVTSIARDKAYDIRPVSDLLSELTQLIDGPDFDVDPVDGYVLGLGQVQGNFRAYAQQGSDKPNAVFAYGPGAVSNVRNMQRAYLPVINRATVTSTLFDAVSGTSTGVPIAGTYDASNLTFGIRENVSSFPDATSQATLDSAARGAVIFQTSPREVITIGEPTRDGVARPFEHYYLGDTIRASCRKGSMVFTNRSLRVHGIDLELDANGYAAVKLTTAAA